MRSIYCIIFALLITLSPATAVALQPVPYRPGSTGIDVSWPQGNCTYIHHKPLNAAFAIVGVNHGLDYTENPCLLTEVNLLGDYSLYLNTGYPGLSFGRKNQSFPKHCSWSNNRCLAFNWGFNDVIYSLRYISLHNVHTTNWWLDVETDNSWTNNSLTNIASLQGMVAALHKYTFLPSVGFYASPYQWKLLTGNWKNGLSAWTATGEEDSQTAINACKETSFTGGKIVLTQYTIVLDQDYACPNGSD